MMVFDFAGLFLVHQVETISERTESISERFILLNILFHYEMSCCRSCKYHYNIIRYLVCFGLDTVVIL